MMTKKMTTGLLLMTCAMLAVYAPARAAEDVFDESRWQLRLRAVGVIPDDSSTVNIGGDADVGDAVVPEFDITYFFTDNIAAELILATAEHQLDYTGGVNLGDTMILPPTLTLQYHFTPDQAFSPYVGAGVNYSMFYGEDAGTGFTDLDVDGGVGVAAQVGFDYWLNDNWGLNFDAKKIWLDVDATLNNGTIRADVELDPWVVGGGISYRF
jgi:outer membrane protein